MLRLASALILLRHHGMVFLSSFCGVWGRHLERCRAEGRNRIAHRRQCRGSAGSRATLKPHALNLYSIRNASVGFTAEARCAGMKVAASPAEHRTKMAIAITTGSEGFTS